MNTVFRSEHILRAALQVKGVSVPVIDDFIRRHRELAKSPESYDEWNKELDPKGIQTLTMMLGPDGEQLSSIFLDGLYKSITAHYGISKEEIEAWWMRN